MPIRRIAACGRDARAPCLSPPISRLTSSRIAACGRDARAPRHAGDARYLSRPFRCSLARTQAYRGGAAVRARHAVPQHLSNTPERPQVAPAEIHLIDLIVFAPGARSRRSTVLRFAAEGVLSRRARTRHSRSASGRKCAICLRRACSRSFRSPESPVSALEMEVFRSVQREGSTSGVTTEHSSAEPGRHE
jgi:hypothetical protein